MSLLGHESVVPFKFTKLKTCRPVPADGDCFFTAVARAIGTSAAAHAHVSLRITEYQQRNPSSRWHTTLSPALLRSLVAVEAGCSSHAEVTSAIQQWTEVPDAFPHMAHLDLVSRLTIARCLLDKAKYWADEFTIQLLERLLRVRFVIWNAKGRGLVSLLHSVVHDASWQPAFYVLLLRTGQHYENVGLDGGERVFTHAPARLRAIALKCYKNSAYPYVKLDDL